MSTKGISKLLKQREHIDAFLGAFDLDIPKNTKDAFWEQVYRVMTLLYKEYPYEMIDEEMNARYQRENSLNKFHASKDMQSRMMGSIPPRFNAWISNVYPHESMLPYPTRRQLDHEFFKKYPQFSYAEKL